jgi:predicted DNA-binding transcriptional regulator AlpA
MREVMTYPEALVFVGKTRPTLIRWINQGLFPKPFKLVGRWYFYRDEVEAFMCGQWSK